jgi:hypothetical protein
MPPPTAVSGSDLPRVELPGNSIEAGISHCVQRVALCEETRHSPPAIDSSDIVVNPGLKGDRDRRCRLTALQREVAGADQMAHYAVADPNREAPQPHAARARCACTRLAAADLKRVTSGGSRLGNAMASVVADPSFEVDSPMIRLG